MRADRAQLRATKVGRIIIDVLVIRDSESIAMQTVTGRGVITSIVAATAQTAPALKEKQAAIYGSA